MPTNQESNCWFQISLCCFLFWPFSSLLDQFGLLLKKTTFFWFGKNNSHSWQVLFRSWPKYLYNLLGMDKDNLVILLWQETKNKQKVPGLDDMCIFEIVKNVLAISPNHKECFCNLLILLNEISLIMCFSFIWFWITCG